MLIELQTAEYRCRFFDRFDAEGRNFEDELRGARGSVESIPWPRISFWQGYRHLESGGRRYFVLQMTRKDSKRSHQLAVVERSSRLPIFKTGDAPYWIPSLESGSFKEQVELLAAARKLFRENTSMMSLRVHAYVPGEPGLDLAERLLRESGFEACARQAPARTRLIDLRAPIEEILARFPTKVRTKLKIKKPGEVRVEELTSRELIPELQAALDDSFRRSADRGGDFDFESLFAAIERTPEQAAAFGLFLSGDPSPKAFITGVASAPLFEYTAAGSRSDRRLRQFPFNYILLWKLVEAAKARGAEIFDMGGITDGGPGDPLAGISDFKRRFPGFEKSTGREMVLELRPARRRLFLLLRALKG